MNKVILIGNLVSAPEMRQTQSGIACANFRLAVQRRFKNKDGEREADFINIVAWRQLAELCGKYLGKGSKCGVVGSIMTRSYDGSDGNRRYVTEVVAEEIDFLSRAENAGGGKSDGVTRQSAPMGEPPAEEWQQVEDDELPF